MKPHKVIQLGDEAYTCTLTAKFRRHTAEELDLMRESIKADGILNPVRVYHDTDLDLAGCVLDGEGRLGIAAELDCDVPVKYEGRLSTDAAYERAKAFNDARRQDSPEEVRRRRVKRVAEKRAEGKSIRTIAEEESVSPTQIAADLKDSGVQGGEHLKVTGKDGKRQAAKKKPGSAKPGPKPKPRVEKDQKPTATTSSPAAGGSPQEIVITAADEAAEKAKQSTPPKPGRQVFDWTRWDKTYGPLVRLVEELANAYPGERQSADYRRADALLGDLGTAWQGWQARLTRTRQEAV